MSNPTDKQVDEAVAYFEHLKCGDDCRCEDCQQWKVILTALAALREERRKVEQWMRFSDIRKCDIAACNCGMWHGGERSWEARYKELKYQIESGEIVVNKGGNI